jgi:hypothetical protein
VADRQKYEVRDVGVEDKRKDEEDAESRVGCGGFDDHDGSRLVRTDVPPPEGISHFHSGGKETAGNEESVEDGQSDLEAEICELGVGVIKDGTVRFGEDNNGHG